MKKILIFSLYLGGAFVLFLILGAIGLANLDFNLGGKSREEEQVKNRLKYGVKECVIRNVEDLPTNFDSIAAFRSESTSYLKNFQIIKTEKNSCFNAKAVPKKEIFTWFEIDTKETGEVLMTCGDSSKPGCEEGNTW